MTRDEIEKERREAGGDGGGAGPRPPPPPPPPSSWCTKIFEYVKNRNRIGPDKLELADCDFFIVGPRRTLRVLVPRRFKIYDKTAAVEELPPSSPSSGDRSFGGSKNHSRTAANDYYKPVIDKNLLRLAKNSNSQVTLSSSIIAEIDRESREDISSGSPTIVDDDDDGPVKRKIVNDLEEYIERLLREVLSDTIKLLNNADGEMSLDKESREATKNIDKCWCEGKVCSESCRDNLERWKVFLIENEERNDENDKNDEIIKWSKGRGLVVSGGGYVNRGFTGSADCLVHFDIDDESATSGRCPAPNERQNFHFTDSGINSVETMEASSREASLEESLMEIIEAKFGKFSTDTGPTTARIDLPKIVDKDKTNEHLPLPDEPNISGKISIESNRQFDSNITQMEETRAERAANIGSSETENSVERVDALREKLARKNSNDQRGLRERVEKISTDSTDEIEENFKYRKPIVVFLHGFGSSAEIFENQLEYFSNLGYPCVAPELLGHGMSSAPDRSKDYHFDKLFKDLEMVLGHYAFRSGRKCVLVAHNYGCSFATALARKYEGDINRLVLISGGGPTPLAPPSTEGTGHSFLRAVLTPLLVCGLGRNILYSPRGRQHPYCGTTEQSPYHMKYVLEGMIWPEGDYVFHRTIKTPTLLIHGLRDDSVSLVQECQMERTMIKAFLDAIPTAGRAPMIDSPEQVNRMIHRFIDARKRKKS